MGATHVENLSSGAAVTAPSRADGRVPTPIRGGLLRAQALARSHPGVGRGRAPANYYRRRARRFRNRAEGATSNPDQCPEPIDENTQVLRRKGCESRRYWGRSCLDSGNTMGPVFADRPSLGPFEARFAVSAGLLLCAFAVLFAVPPPRPRAAAQARTGLTDRVAGYGWKAKLRYCQGSLRSGCDRGRSPKCTWKLSSGVQSTGMEISRPR